MCMREKERKPVMCYWCRARIRKTDNANLQTQKPFIIFDKDKIRRGSRRKHSKCRSKTNFDNHNNTDIPTMSKRKRKNHIIVEKSNHAVLQIWFHAVNKYFTPADLLLLLPLLSFSLFYCLCQTSNFILKRLPDFLLGHILRGKSFQFFIKSFACSFSTLQPFS